MNDTSLKPQEDTLENLLTAAIVTAALAVPSAATLAAEVMNFDIRKRSCVAHDEGSWGYYGQVSTGDQDHKREILFPNDWGLRFEACGRQLAPLHRQSPIELPAAADRTATSIGDVRLPDRLATRVSVEHNCHTVQATVLQQGRDATGDLLLDGQPYRLLQFHIHTPSEHVVQAGPGGTVNFPGELHFVHAAVSSTGDLDASRLAVVGVFIDITDHEHNPVADRFFEALTRDYLKERTSGHEAGPIGVDVGSLWAPAESFWRYRGSLTTPPCTESVEWVLSADPLLLSRDTYRSIQQSRLDVGFANTRPPFLPTSQHQLRFSGR